MKLLKYILITVTIGMSHSLFASDYDFIIIKFDSNWSVLYYFVTLNYSDNYLQVSSGKGIHNRNGEGIAAVFCESNAP